MSFLGGREAGQRRSWRRRAFVLHRVLGLVAALPLLLIAGSGVLLGGYEELRARRAPPARQWAGAEAPLSLPLSLTGAVTAAQRAFTGAAVEVIYLPRFQEAMGVRLRLPAGRRLVAYLDPATLQVLGQRAAPDWLELAVQVHRGKLLGVPGQVLAIVAGTLAAPLWLLGLGVSLRRGGRISLHRRLGSLGGGLVTLVALLGAGLSLCLLLQAEPPPAARSAPGPGPAALQEDALARRARAAHRDGALRNVYLPEQAGSPVLFYFADDTRLWLDPLTGAVTRREARAASLRSWLYLLHTGRILGRIGPKIIGAVGAFAVLLVITGLRRRYLWASTRSMPSALATPSP